MRRWWVNLVLLLVVIGLGLFAWKRSDQTQQDDTRLLLTDLKTDAIDRIDIKKADATITLQRNNGVWRLTAPINARGNDFAIESVVHLAQAPSEGRLTPTADDLGRYGLSKPKLVVRLNDSVIEFGDLHPFKDQYYARHGDAIHLVSSGYYAQAAQPYTGFIDTRLLIADSKPVAFKLPGFALTLKDGTWQRAPEDKALSSDRINAFVEEWRHARALNVKASTAAPGKERITITFADDTNKLSTLTLSVLARTPELVLLRADEQLEYHFPAETAQRLLNLRADNPN